MASESRKVILRVLTSILTSGLIVCDFNFMNLSLRVRSFNRALLSSPRFTVALEKTDPTETLIKKVTSNKMAIINIESNASDGEIEWLRIAFNRHCPVLDYLSKSSTVELEFKTARKNKKLSA